MDITIETDVGEPDRTQRIRQIVNISEDMVKEGRRILAQKGLQLNAVMIEK